MLERKVDIGGVRLSVCYTLALTQN